MPAAARASILHMLPAHLEHLGIAPDDVFGQAGITLGALSESAVVHRAQLHSVLSLAAQVTGTPEIALALGQAADTARLGPAGLALTAGATLEQCLRGHIALMPRLQSMVNVALGFDASWAILSHHLLGDRHSAWLMYEGAAAYHIKQLKTFIGNDWAPSRVTFAHSRRGRLKVYQDFFNCPVQFGIGEGSRIYFPRECLQAPRPKTSGNVRQSRKELAPVGTFCPQHIERFALNGDWVLNAVACMAQAVLPHHALTISTAAARLGLSERTIQRRLADIDCTYEDIIDGIRQRIAVERLTSSSESVTAIAMSLGYSDAAHFNRAFRRWMGCSPSDFRASAEPGPPSSASVPLPQARS